jgi:predicted RNA-binding protein with PUA-like domain
MAGSRKPKARKKGAKRVAAKKRAKPAVAKKRAKPAAAKKRAKPAAVKKEAKPAAKQRAVTAVPPYAEGKWAEWFARAPGERRYWLVKSEPSAFSFDDLLRAPNRTTHWDGVRNFAARNFLRDGMKVGDRVLFYHSMADPQHIAGICEVVREGYADHTALDPKHPHFDPGSNPDAPQWYMVDLRAVAQLTRPVTLPELKSRRELADMALLRIGRLSVTPVRQNEWDTIVSMAG